MNLPLITVITPTYNCKKTLEATLSSVVSQHYANLEYWLIDGLSTDGSLEIIQKYANKYSFIKFISQKDNGIYDAMNKGLSLAKGDWIYFLGGDDVLSEGILNRIFATNTLPSADFIYGNVRFVPSNRIHDGAFDMGKLMTHSICHQAIFIRKSVYDKLGTFNINYKIHADWEYNWRCFADKSLNILYIDVIIADYYEAGMSAIIKDTEFYKDKTERLLYYFSDRKATYMHLGDGIFEIIKSGNLWHGWRVLFKAAHYNGNFYHYLKNGLYWTRQRFFA